MERPPQERRLKTIFFLPFHNIPLVAGNIFIMEWFSLNSSPFYLAVTNGNWDCIQHLRTIPVRNLLINEQLFYGPEDNLCKTSLYTPVLVI